MKTSTKPRIQHGERARRSHCVISRELFLSLPPSATGPLWTPCSRSKEVELLFASNNQYIKDFHKIGRKERRQFRSGYTLSRSFHKPGNYLLNATRRRESEKRSVGRSRWRRSNRAEGQRQPKKGEAWHYTPFVESICSKKFDIYWGEICWSERKGKRFRLPALWLANVE